MPIIVTDTDDLQRMFAANIYGFILGINVTMADRLAVSLIEIMRANCPPPPDLIDALGNHWTPAGFDVYVDEDGNLIDRAALDEDPELGPVTEIMED